MTVGGGAPLLLIAGPCVIESEAHAVETGARRSRDIAAAPASVRLQGVVRQGEPHVGAVLSRSRAATRGCACSARVREAAGVPILTDIHEPCAGRAARPRSPTSCRSRRSSSRQTDLIVAAARTGRVVNIKKGQFLAPARHAARDREGDRERATTR